MKYTRQYEKKQAILRDLKNFKGNKKLLEYYQKILADKTKKNVIQLKQYEIDMIRVKYNLKFILDIIQVLPAPEKEFIKDVFIDESLTQEQILKKYHMKIGSFHYYCDKAASLLADIKFN